MNGPVSDANFLPLDEAMKLHIESALQATRGRIEGTDGAAALLKINPHTLRARMRKLKIAWSDYRKSAPWTSDGFHEIDQT
jgi:hydrogenase-4 transcriptional activator